MLCVYKAEADEMTPLVGRGDPGKSDEPPSWRSLSLTDDWVPNLKWIVPLSMDVYRHGIVTVNMRARWPTLYVPLDVQLLPIGGEMCYGGYRYKRADADGFWVEMINELMY